MAYYLGIDGGGTKTRCLLADETTVLAKAMTGGSNIVRLGETQAREALHAAVRHVCAAARISPGSDPRHLYRRGRRCPARDRGEDSQHPRRTDAPEQSHQHRSRRRHRDRPRSRFRRGTRRDRDCRHRLHRLRARRLPVAPRAPEAGGSPSPTKAPATGSAAAPSPLFCSARDQGLETALTAMVLQAWKLATIDELVQQANSTPPPDFPRLFPIVLRAADERRRHCPRPPGRRRSQVGYARDHRPPPPCASSCDGKGPKGHAPRSPASRSNDGQCLSSVSRCAPGFLQYPADNLSRHRRPPRSGRSGRRRAGQSKTNVETGLAPSHTG